MIDVRVGTNTSAVSTPTFTFRYPHQTRAPTLRAALHMIARPCGFLGGKGDGEPGVKSLWIGLQRVASCVEGMRFAPRCG